MAPGPLPAAAAAILLLASGCPRRLTTFVHPQADFSLIRRVAVLPLENLTQEPTAAEKVRQLLIIQLLSSGSVEVVDVGEVARGLRAANVSNPASPGTEDLRRLGKELGVEAVLGGSVQEFAQGRAAGAPATSVALVFRMMETETGQVIWSSSVSKSGVGAMARLFGVGGDSATERARKLIEKALDSLIR
jgi:TolB-like protein